MHTAGAWCAAAGLVGVAQAALVLAWPKQVSVDRFSYPFTSTGFVVAQATFALQHIPLAIGVAALGGLPAVRASRAARIGVIGAVVGLALLALLEVIAMSAYGEGQHSSYGKLVETRTPYRCSSRGSASPWPVSRCCAAHGLSGPGRGGCPGWS